MTLNISSGAAPVINSPFLYVNGLQVSWLSNTTLTMGIGQCRDSTDTYDIQLSTLATLNAANNGFNGLDTGALAINTTYALFVIDDPVSGNPTGMLLSTSSTAPTMPFGYSAFRLVDFVRTDGSAHFLKFYNTGTGSTRYKQYDTRVTVLTGGASTTYAAVSLAGAVPISNFGKVTFVSSYVPAVAGNAANLQPTGGAGDIVTLIGQVATVAVGGSFSLLPLIASSNAEVSYKVTASDALTLYVAGYDYYL